MVQGQRPGLGNEFLADLQATLTDIAEAPAQFETLHRGTRRALLRRFPYAVFYREVADRLIVVAVYHAKRSPSGWKRRIP